MVLLLVLRQVHVVRIHVVLAHYRGEDRAIVFYLHLTEQRRLARSSHKQAGTVIGEKLFP